MLSKPLNGQLILYVKTLKNKPAPTIENGLIIFSNLIIDQILDIRNVYLSTKGYCK